MKTHPLSPRPRLHTTLVIGCWLLGSLTPVFGIDQVTRRSDNVTLRGEFQAMTTEAVTIRLTNGREESVSVADIKTLRFDQEPTLLAQAQSNERSGALDAALEKYLQVQNEYSGGNQRLITDLSFLIARTKCRLALTSADQYQEALEAIRAFRTTHSDNFRYLEATLLEASVAAAAGDATTARTLLQDVQNSPVTGFQLQAGVQLGELLLETGDVAAALNAFNTVVTQSEGDSNAAAAHWSGLLGRARCQQEQGQFAAAVATAEEVISGVSQSDTEILAQAWIRKGDCYRLQNEPKAALMAYLHVDVLYPTEPAEHAQSLYQLTQLWGPAGHQDRADDAAARLTELYPGSPWAGRLRQGG